MKPNSVILHNLRKTNDMLQNELRQLNNKINDALFHKKREVLSPPKETAPKDNKEILSKRIELYEKEENRLNSRISQLSDPSYEPSLIQKIQSKQTKVTELETAIKNKKYTTKRKAEKLISEAEEVGEDVHPAVLKLHKDINVYSLKVRNAEEKIQLIAKSQEEANKRLDSITQEYQQLQDKNVPEDDIGLKIKKRHERTSGILTNSTKKYDLQTKKLNRNVEVFEKQLKVLNAEYNILLDRYQQKETTSLELKLQEEEIKLLKRIKHRSKHSFSFISEFGNTPKLTARSISPGKHIFSNKISNFN